MSRQQAHQTFWEHVGALRRHIIAAALAFAIALCAVLPLLNPIVRLLVAPIQPTSLIFLSPLGSFAFQMRVAMWGAVLVSAPAWLLIFLHFLGPALPRKAQTLTWLITAVSIAFAVAALIATYAFVFPWSLQVLRATAVPGTEFQLTADSYLDLLILEAAFVLILFELPLILALATSWGWLDPTWITRRRPAVYLVLLIVVAIATPTTDIVSLLVSMVPASLSLELGILAARLIHNRRKRLHGDTV